MTARRSVSAVVCAVVLATSAGACGRSRQPLGGGPEVDVCGGYDAYDDLPEPDAADGEEVLAWTAAFLRVVERTQVDDDVRDREGDRKPVPKEVSAAVPVLERSIVALRRRVQAAVPKGPEAVRAATDSLALDADFARADRVIGEFRSKTCR